MKVSKLFGDQIGLPGGQALQKIPNNRFYSYLTTDQPSPLRQAQGYGTAGPRRKTQTFCPVDLIGQKVPSLREKNNILLPVVSQF